MGSILSALQELWHIIVIGVIACCVCACCAGCFAIGIGIPVHETRKKKKALKRQYQVASSSLGQSGGSRSAGEVWQSTGYDQKEAARVQSEQRINNALAVAANTTKLATGTAFIP